MLLNILQGTGQLPTAKTTQNVDGAEVLKALHYRKALANICRRQKMAKVWYELGKAQRPNTI